MSRDPFAFDQLDPVRGPKRSAGGAEGLLWPFLLRTLSNIISIVVGVVVLALLLRLYVSWEVKRFLDAMDKKAPTFPSKFDDVPGLPPGPELLPPRKK